MGLGGFSTADRRLPTADCSARNPPALMSYNARSMKRRTKIIIVVIVLILIAGITTASIRSKSKEGTPVTFGKVERLDLTSKVSANGQIDAQRKVDLEGIADSGDDLRRQKRVSAQLEEVVVDADAFDP